MKTQRVYNSPPAGSGGGWKKPPEGFEKNTRHWVRITSGIKNIGTESGRFVEFGHKDNRLSGVLRGSNLAQYQEGDIIYAEMDNLFFSASKDQWKFDFIAISSQDVQFPLIRQGHVIIPQSVTGSKRNGAVPRAFSAYVQPQGEQMEFVGDDITVTIGTEVHDLLCPAGFCYMVDEIVAGKQTELTLLPIDNDFPNRILLAHSDFPGVAIGYAFVEKEDKVAWAQPGQTIKFRFNLKQGRAALVYKDALAQELVFERCLEPKMEQVFGELQKGDPLELILVRKENGGYWKLAHPLVPDKIIGDANVSDDQKFVPGDRAFFFIKRSDFTSSSLANGTIDFSLHLKNFTKGEVLTATIGDRDEGITRCTWPVQTKGRIRQLVPDCFIPHVYIGDQIEVQSFGYAQYSGPLCNFYLAVPTKAIPAFNELLKLLLGEFTVELAGGYTTRIVDGSCSQDQGHYVFLKIDDYIFKGFALTGKDLGFVPGKKIIVKAANEKLMRYSGEPEWVLQDMAEVGLLLQFVKNVEG